MPARVQLDSEGAIMKCRYAMVGLAAVVLATAPFPSFPQATEAASTTAANDLPSPDKEFVQAATMSNSTEIDTGKMATEQSYNSKVKSFGRTMLTDHSLMTVKLKMATPHGAAAPKDNSDTALISSLKPLRGVAFDRAYLQKVGVDAHKKTIAAFETEAQNGKVQDLKELAANSLPKLKEHYQMAKDLMAGKGPRAIVDQNG